MHALLSERSGKTERLDEIKLIQRAFFALSQRAFHGHGVQTKSRALWGLLLCAHWDPALFATAEAETAAVKRWLESFKNVENTSTYRKEVG